MPSPFFNAIKGTTAGTPGTGAFTPNAAATGFRAWSLVPAGWIGVVRFEEGSAWSIAYSYWNGTTLSRGANQLIASSTGSILSLTSAATASLVVGGSEVQPHIIGTGVRGTQAVPGSSTPTAIGSSLLTANGTAAAVSIATTSFRTELPQMQHTSAGTADAHAGWSTNTAHAVFSTTAGRGGYEYSARFGISQLGTGQRLYAGMFRATVGGTAGEPSAKTNFVGFIKDSTDTNIQFASNDGSGTATKNDSGIALAVDGVYETTVWAEPGGVTAGGLLIRLDTGAIYYKTVTTDLPTAGVAMPQLIAGIGGAGGTATIFHPMQVYTRPGN